jgi:hypothetical protein
MDMGKPRQTPAVEPRSSEDRNGSKWGNEPLVTIDGATFVLQPVEDLTKTMSPERVEEFIRNYKASEKPANRFDEAQALERFRQRQKQRRNG